MKNKLFVAFAIVTTAIICIFSGCSIFGNTGAKETEVSTLQQLKAVTGGSVKLKNNIDCEYDTIKSISCDKFDGNGFTISNCFIEENDFYGSASFFTKDIKEVKNVNFNNINVTGTNGISAAVVAVGNCEQIENVHITNSKITCTQSAKGNNMTKTARKCYVGGIYAGYIPHYKNGAPTEYFDCKITNCSVSDTIFELFGCADSSAVAAEIYVGGIAGGCNDISDSSTINCKITAKSTSVFNYPYIAGIVANSNGNIERCFAENNDIYAEAKHYSAGGGGYASSKTYMGSVAAYAKGTGKIRYCYAKDNHLAANCSGSIYVGGLAGYVDGVAVSQSYSNHNYIVMYGYSETANSSLASVKAQRRAGGLIGTSVNNNITSCFTYNEDTLAENCVSILTDSNHSKIGGFVAGIDSINVSFCAAYSKNLISSITDSFIPSKVSTNNCYVCNNKFGDVNNCKIVEQSFWKDKNEIKETLNLVGSNWKFDENEIPYLHFTDN